MKQAFIWLCLLLIAMQAQAQDGIEPYVEYRKRIDDSQRITPHDSSLFGDATSLYDGSTSFTVIDIDLPGNNGLPVQLARRHAVEIQPQGWSIPPYDVNLKSAGNWDVEIPYMAATYPQSSGWNALRCSVGSVPPLVHTQFHRFEYWQGITAHVPGRGNTNALGLQTSVPRPSDGSNYRLTTTERDAFDCIPMKSGLTGEGFRMTTTTGLRYYFDVGTVRTAAALEKYVTVSVVTGSHPIRMDRSRYYLLASKIEDRFGNTVEFQYDATGNPTRIWSSDGREITLAYSGGRLSSATSHGRTWQYQYTALGAGSHGLTTVIQPDDSRWEYTYSGDLKPPAPHPNQILPPTAWCQGPAPWAVVESYVLNATHPSGATGVFAFTNRRHYRSGVHATECMPDGPDPTTSSFTLLVPHYFDVMSLDTKAIGGPGTPAMTWSYNYNTTPELLWGTHTSPPSYPCTTCTQYKTVVVTNPDGTKQNHRFGIVYQANDGRELQVETLRTDNTVIRTETSTYMAESSVPGQPFYGEYGNVLGGIFDPASARVRPVVTKSIVQDSTTFTWQANSFDVFARPKSVTRSSTLSGSPSRTEETTYHDNTSKWVLGQVSQVKCTAPTTALPSGCGTSGTLMFERTYDSTWALPLVSKRFGKTVQTLTWDTTSSIASGQLGTVKTVADGNGNLITPSNWKRGIPQSIQYPGTPESPSGATRSAVVNDSGWITSVTDENGYTTGYTHDAMGRLASIAYPSGDSTVWNTTTQSFQQIASAEYGIPAGHWRQTVSTGNGRKITYFDALWRPLVVREYDTANEPATQRFQRFAYDHAGRVTFASYPATVHNPATGTHTGYDALGRVVQVQQDSELSPSLLTTTTEYLTGFQTRVTDPKGHQTTTSHLAWDQPDTSLPVHIARTGNSHTHITRDIFGKPTQLRRSNSSSPGGGTGIDRSYTYNTHQELCRSVEPETGATLMGYDNAGNLTWSAAGLPGGQACEANGTTPTVAARRVDRSYDARNRLTTLAFPDGRGNQWWTWTPDGLPASITTHNTSGGAVVSNSYAYNKRRLPVQETMAPDALNTWSLTYGYNANGHLASHGYPAGLTTAYTVNALGQVTQITAQDVTTVNVVGNASYFPNGAIQSFTYGNGITYTATQNTRGLPLRTIDCATTGPCTTANRRMDLEYGYDRNGNVSGILDHTAGGRQTRSMGYDTLDRLTQVTSSMFGTASYDYDVQDNLTRVQVGASALHPARDHWYCYNNNRLGTVRTGSCSGGIVSSLGYDVQGNITSKGSQSFGFDYGNRLRDSGGVSQYLYDGHGRRVRYTGTGAAPYLYSQYDQTGKLRWQRDEQTGQRIRHIYLGNRLVAEHRKPIGINTPTIEYLHADALGSPIARTDAAKTTLETSEYEPYGRLLNRANDDKPGYTGHVQDAATGLTYMQQRYYDPVLGVFLSVDPVTAYQQPITNFCRHCYARNNPYKFNDPDGRVAQVVWGAVIGAGVEVFIQTQIQGKSFRDVDLSDVAIAAGAGAITGGIASAAALSVAKGTVKVGSAVAQASAGAGAVGVTASLAKDVANGEAPKVGDALVNGAASAVLGAAGQRLTLNPVAKLESQWSRGGLNATVAETTRAANQAGPDAAKVAAATSVVGSNVSDAAGVAVDVVRAKYDEKPR